MNEPAPVVLVTGASGGIGGACVEAFLAAGSRVIAADIEPGDAMPGAGFGPERYQFIRTDISEEESVTELIARTIGLFGRLDVLVNNAAVLTPTKAVHETALDELERAIAVNLRGTFLCCKRAYSQLKSSRGCIVNVSSMAGVLGEKNHAIYAATKGAINSLTLSMAADYGVDGIRCNAVCPGAVQTPNAARAIRNSPDAAYLFKMRDSLSALGSTATPQQVASVVVFLASPAAGFMTGALVPVSGGLECGYGIKY
jgi:NAD(P)-dependent dehydrogenase (short-subunit alcohol dehydrogenase family)